MTSAWTTFARSVARQMVVVAIVTTTVLAAARVQACSDAGVPCFFDSNCCSGDCEGVCIHACPAGNAGDGCSAFCPCSGVNSCGIDFTCHAPCVVARNCSHPYGDGNCPTLGCCGGPGERQCCTFCAGSDAPSACAPGLVAAITCQRPRALGENCGPDAPCGTGLSCDIDFVCHHVPRQEGEPCTVFNQCGSGLQCATGTFPDKCIPFRKIGEECDAFGHLCEDNLQCPPFVQKCYPDAGDQLFDKQQCLAFYSSDVQQSAVDANSTLNFGVGSVASAGASGSDEVDVVYGQDGKYGCYLTTCVGGVTNLAIGSAACAGITTEWDQFVGNSTVIVEEAGEGVSFSTSQSLDGDGNLNGTADCFSVSLDLSPVAAGVYTCDTIVRQVLPVNAPPTAVCKPNMTVSADANCQAYANIQADGYVNDGSSVNQNPPAPYAIGARFVTLTVTNVDGASASCSTLVTVVDDTDPVFAGCPNDVTVFTGLGRATCDQVATWREPQASDSCGILSYTSTHNPGDTFAVGGTTVTYTTLDAATNRAMCSFTVTVVDDTPPGSRPFACTASCTGDCDASRNVTVNELITLVNIALDTDPASACPSGIPTGAAVDIALLLQAVNHALSGCTTS